jgi:hypothetical protein
LANNFASVAISEVVSDIVRFTILRERLAAIFQEWRAPFAACLAEAQAVGEIE